MAGLKRYLINIFIALDFLLNAAFGGEPSETLTRRAARAKGEGRRWGCVLCWVLEQLDHGHCRRWG